MGQLKILIVEDIESEAQHIKSVLEELSYTVIGIADSVESALELYCTQLPDILIIDILLNGKKDGIAVAQKLREATEKPCPVIFLTHLLDKETFELAKKTNPFNYLLKPFHIRELEFAIELAVELSIQKPGL